MFLEALGYYFKKFKKKNKKNGFSKILSSELDRNLNDKGSSDKSFPDKKSSIETIIKSELASDSKKRSQDDILTSLTVKFLTTKEIIGLMEKRDYTRLYYLLSCLKILSEISQQLKLDPEELESITKAF